MVGHLCLFDNFDPDFVIYYAENAIVVADVPLKPTILFVELANETIAQVRHCAAEGIEDVCLKVHEINGEFLFTLDLRFVFFFSFSLLFLVTRWYQASSKPKAVV